MKESTNNFPVNDERQASFLSQLRHRKQSPFRRYLIIIGISIVCAILTFVALFLAIVSPMMNTKYLQLQTQYDQLQSNLSSLMQTQYEQLQELDQLQTTIQDINSTFLQQLSYNVSNFQESIQELNKDIATQNNTMQKLALNVSTLQNIANPSIFSFQLGRSGGSVLNFTSVNGGYILCNFLALIPPGGEYSIFFQLDGVIFQSGSPQTACDSALYCPFSSTQVTLTSPGPHEVTLETSSASYSTTWGSCSVFDL